MRVFNIVAMFCIALVLAACSDPKPIFRTDLPKATALVLYKAERRMFLFQGNRVIKEYDFKLGFAPIGHKQFEGDGKPPRGNISLIVKIPTANFIYQWASLTPMRRIDGPLGREVREAIFLYMARRAPIASSLKIGLGAALR